MKSRIFLFSLIFLIGGCIGDEFDFDNLDSDAQISPRFSTPIGKASITLADLVSDTLENVNYDSSGNYPYISFSFREDSIFSYSGSDFFEVSESGSETYRMGEISIDDFGPVNSSISFGEMLDNANNYPTTVTYLKNADSTSTSFPEISDPPLSIDGQYETESIGNFRIATFKSGEISITLTNNMPVEITANFDLFTKVLDESDNPVDSFLLQQYSFTDIPPDNTETQVFDLAGETLGSIIYMTNLEISTPGSTSDVFIDLDNQNLNLSVSSSNLLIESGEVAITEQELYKKRTAVSVGSEGDKQIDTISLQDGGLDYTIRNNSSIAAELLIKLPKSQYASSSDTVREYITLPPNTDVTGTMDLANTLTILTGVDSMPINYRVELDNSQEFSSFNASDEIDFNYNLTLNSTHIDYISGYFGQDTIKFAEESINTGIDIFSNIAGGLTLTNPQLKFFFTNTIGVPFSVDLDMTGQSSEGETASLNSDLLHFDYPSNPGNVLEDTVTIDNTNSDIVDLIALPPKTIDFKGQGYINHPSVSSQHNFITSENEVQVGMLMDLPLELKTSSMIFKDTMEFDTDMEFEGEINLYAKFTNQFPFSLNVKLICIDSKTNTELLTLEPKDENQQSAVLIEAPQVDENGRVNSPVKNTVFFHVTGDDIDKLNQADEIVFIATLATSGTEGVKFYTDYKLDIAVGIKNTGTTIDF